MVTLEDCKLYLRIDTDYEDSLIESFIEVAESYLIDGVTNYLKNYAADEKYAAKADLLKKVIVNELYNNRDSRNDTRDNFSFTVQSMINQLKYYAPEVAEHENDRQHFKPHFPR